MYCTQCGRELMESVKFCSECGKAARSYSVFPQTPPVPLSRPMREKRIAGVCAGFARYLGVDVTLVRIVWLVVALLAGVGFIVYLAAWIAMPKDEGTSLAPVSRTSPSNQEPESHAIVNG